MTIADSRVVPYSPRIVQTFKEAIVAFRADPDGKWIKREEHESLLAEADRNFNSVWNDRRRVEIALRAVEKERDALKSRLDAVLGWAAEIENYLADRSDVVDGDYGQPAPNAEMKLLQELTDLRTTNRSAALGGES